MKLILTAVAGVIALVGVSACSGGSTPPTAPTPPVPSVSSAPVTTTTPMVDGESSATSSPSSSPSPSKTRASSSSLSQDDQDAGLLNRKVLQSAGGSLTVVKGSSRAPGRGEVYRVRVEVEGGIALDRRKFADFVLDTLNDRRSWTEQGRRTFARTDGPADIRVVLASPEKSAAICRPLQTFGKLSCRHGDEAVLTMFRWVKGIPGYDGDLDGYRHYVVNHEVGHVLGHAHEYCAGSGKRAPVMMQQTKGLKGCRPNPWPYPER